MIIREYQESDLERLKALHEQSGFDFKFPNPDNFFCKRVVESDSTLVMAAFGKLTAEAYLFCDPDWRNPAWRLEAIRQLHNQCLEDAHIIGVKEACAFLPPGVEKSFGKRLIRMGWEPCRVDWRTYCREVPNA